MKSPRVWRNIPGKEHKPKIVKRGKCDRFDSGAFIESWKMEKPHAKFQRTRRRKKRNTLVEDLLTHIPYRRQRGVSERGHKPLRMLVSSWAANNISSRHLVAFVACIEGKSTIKRFKL
jgi:hypothetical protein